MRVYIELCVKWNYDPEFERVSNIIKSIKTDVEISSNQNPPRSGAFEVSINDKLIFSKFKLNRFPTEDEIRGWL